MLSKKRPTRPPTPTHLDECCLVALQCCVCLQPAVCHLLTLQRLLNTTQLVLQPRTPLCVCSVCVGV